VASVHSCNSQLGCYCSCKHHSGGYCTWLQQSTRLLVAAVNQVAVVYVTYNNKSGCYST